MAKTGYDLLVASGLSLTGAAVLAADAEPSDRAADGFLQANSHVLEQARGALRQHCAVPLEYNCDFFATQCENYVPLRELARSFALELRTAEGQGDLPRAADIGLEIVELANATRRGGLLVDSLVGMAIEGIAIDRMRRFRNRLATKDAIRLASGLLRIDCQREPFDSIAARDKEWEDFVGDCDEDTDFLSMELPQPEEHGIDAETEQEMRELLQSIADLPDDGLRAMQKQLDFRNVALLRLLAIETAVHGFCARSGAYPADLISLTPDFVTTIPCDPFTDGALKYHRVPRGFVAYSSGPTGQDTGGHFGNWFSVLAGQADLGLDIYDYDVWCVGNPRPSLLSRCVAWWRRVLRR